MGGPLDLLHRPQADLERLQGSARPCLQADGVEGPREEASRPDPKGWICTSFARQTGRGPPTVGAGHGLGGGLLCETATGRDP